MPLNFPPAPTAYFSRGREDRQNTQASHSKEGDVWFRNYPLGISQGERRAVPVEPLTASRHAHRQEPPASRSLDAGYAFSQRSPMIPVQNRRPAATNPNFSGNMRPQAGPQPGNMRPQAGPQPVQNTESAADRFLRANKNLPDGVRYEPLDEETMKILRGSQRAPQSPEKV